MFSDWLCLLEIPILGLLGGSSGPGHTSVLSAKGAAHQGKELQKALLAAPYVAEKPLKRKNQQGKSAVIQGVSTSVSHEL